MVRIALTITVALSLSTFFNVDARAEDTETQTRKLQAGAYEMSYVEHGKGAPVVFVHGTVSDFRWWSAQTEPFGKQFRALAISLPHFYPERWSGEGDDLSIRQHADILAGFIANLQAGPVHLVGHSRGGAIALLMASQHPELLRTLVLMDPSPLVSLLGSTQEVTGAMTERNAFVAAAMERLQQGDREGALERFIDGNGGPGAWQKFPPPLKEMMLDNAWTIRSLPADAREPFTCEDAGRITVPVLLVTGERSPAIYGLMLAALGPCLRSHEKIVIPNAGHGMNRANAPAYNESVIDFLEKHVH